MLRALVAGGPLHLCLFIAILAPARGDLLGNLLGPQCPTFSIASPQAWEPRLAFEAAFEGNPKVTLPPIGSGFNRTLNVDGFCNDILWKSDGFEGNTFGTCSDPKTSASGEWRVKAILPAAKISFDDNNCPLSAISIRRTPLEAPYPAEIRFEFEFCAKQFDADEPSPVSSAAVVMGLQPVNYTLPTMRGTNLVPWMKEVCKVKDKTKHWIVTKSEKVKMLAVGNGTCNSTGASVQVPGITSEVLCQNQCTENITISEIQKITDKEKICSGFAWRVGNPAAVGQNCVMYMGDITQIDRADNEWLCKKEEVHTEEIKKLAPTKSPIATEADLFQTLKLDEVMGGPQPVGMTTAKMMQISSDEDCVKGKFRAAWWFMIQDDFGLPKVLPVTQVEWDDLMKLLPEAKEAQKAQATTVVLDRVLVKTCNKNMTGWGRNCVMPNVETVCDWQQLVNSMVTGFVVPVFGWMIIWCCFSNKSFRNSCMERTGSSTREMDHDTHDEGHVPTCRIGGLIACCLLAILACGGIAAGSSAAVTYGFGAAGCLHGEREMVVVGIAAGVPGALAILIGLLYVYFSGLKHKKAAPNTTYGFSSKNSDPYGTQTVGPGPAILVEIPPHMKKDIEDHYRNQKDRAGSPNSSQIGSSADLSRFQARPGGE